MKKFAVIFLTSCLALSALSSCSKGGPAGENDPHVIVYNDFVPPVLEVSTPTEAQVFSSGNAIAITGKISDDQGLYRGSIKITKDLNGDVVRQQLYEIHGLLTYNFSISETISVTTPADYTVTVTFEDHGYNVVIKSVKVKVNP